MLNSLNPPPPHHDSLRCHPTPFNSYAWILFHWFSEKSAPVSLNHCLFLNVSKALMKCMNCSILFFFFPCLILHYFLLFTLCSLNGSNELWLGCRKRKKKSWQSSDNVQTVSGKGILNNKYLRSFFSVKLFFVHFSISHWSPARLPCLCDFYAFCIDANLVSL